MLGKLFSRPSNATLASPDDALREALLGQPTASGAHVTPRNALQLAVVYSCVRLLSFTCAGLPFNLYRRDGINSEVATDHPLHELLHILPNDEMTSVDHRTMLMASLLLNGTAYNETARDNRGTVREIVPLHPDRMLVDRSKATGKLVYEYHDTDGMRPIRADRMWRINGFTTNGVLGLSPIALARESIGLGMSAEQYGATLFARGGQPAGFVSFDADIKKETRQDAQAAWNEEHRNRNNWHKVPFLQGGAKWQSISLNAEDSQFLETRKFQRAEICGFFGVPPHMVGDLDKATFSNIEHQSLQLVIYTLMPYLHRIEQSVYRDLLTPNERRQYYSKHKVEGLLRGDSKARSEFYRGLFNMGVLTPNQIMHLEEMNTVEGGDHRYMQTAMGRINENGDVVAPNNLKTGEPNAPDETPEPDQK